MVRAGTPLADAFERGTRHHQAGQLPLAEALYRQVLALNPRHADSLHRLGVIALQLGRAGAALPYIDEAIKLQPRAEYHYDRGNVLRALARLPEAEDAYRKALQQRGRFSEALCNLGTVLLMLGRFAEAEPCGRKAVRLRPDTFEEQALLGYSLDGLGRHLEAEACHRAALGLRPDFALAHNNLGHSLSQLGRHGEAELCYRDAIRLDPKFADAHNNLGGCLKDLNRPNEAEACFREALRLQPNSATALTNLADALAQLERYEEAETCCREAVRLNPDFPAAHNTLGSILRSLGRPAEAEAACRVALRLWPDFALAHNNLGCAIRGPIRTAEAAACFREAVRLTPEFAEAHSNLGKALTELGRLEDAGAHLQKAMSLRSNFLEAQVNLGNLMLAQGRYAEIIPQYERVLAEDPDFISAWQGLLGALPYIPDLDADMSSRLHRAFGRAMAKIASIQPLSNDRDPDRRLRVGWLSSDFHDHPVGRNLQLFFAHRNHTAFETFCYADVPVPTTLTEWFRRECDAWRPISGLANAATAELIRRDRIDVMIYLAGRFDRNRPQVAAWRPAPVQVSLFDAATSGLAEMDYFIADRMTVPARPAELFTEHVLRLPNFYLHAAPADSPAVAEPPCLSAGHVTFGCFHNPTKLNPRVLAVWAELLQRIPQSRLRFKYTDLFANPELQTTIRQRIGLPFGERIEFDPIRSPHDKHLAQYNQIDIALDPFPFNGSTATFEALWMGVPVVALAGSTLMGRWAASMLDKVGLNGLIATSPADYVEIATNLASDQHRLAELRHELRTRVLRSPLCDGVRTTRYFERALRAVWRKWCRAPATATLAAKAT